MSQKEEVTFRAPELKAIRCQQLSPRGAQGSLPDNSELFAWGFPQHVSPSGMLRVPRGSQLQVWGCHPYS